MTTMGDLRSADQLKDDLIASLQRSLSDTIRGQHEVFMASLNTIAQLRSALEEALDGWEQTYGHPEMDADEAAAIARLRKLL